MKPLGRKRYDDSVFTEAVMDPVTRRLLIATLSALQRKVPDPHAIARIADLTRRRMSLLYTAAARAAER